MQALFMRTGRRGAAWLGAAWRGAATSDKSLTPRHYLFGFARSRGHERARAQRSAPFFLKSSRENDTSAMNIKRTPTPTDMPTPTLPDDRADRDSDIIRGPVHTRDRR